jgi:hypothetical protein
MGTPTIVLNIQQQGCFFPEKNSTGKKTGKKT